MKSQQDAIYCDAVCQSWLHRGCAGLSRGTVKSDNQFHCPRHSIQKSWQCYYHNKRCQI